MFPSGYFPGATGDAVDVTVIDPADPLTDALNALRALIASVTFFQEWTGEATAQDALTRVYRGEVGYPMVSVSIAGGVLTLRTREPHTIAPGDVITVAGASIGALSEASISGELTVAGVSDHAVTVNTLLDDLEEVYPDGAFIIPGRRPFAVIVEADEGLASSVIGSGGAVVFGGAIDILLEADVSRSYANDAAGALNEARSAYGKFVHGLSLTQGTLDYMCLNNVITASAPQFIALEGQDDNTRRFERWRALVKVTWGIEG